MEQNQTLFLECECHSDEHTLKFMLDPDTDTGYWGSYLKPELYTSVFLNDYRKWYQRLWVAIKYLFGYKCKYGHWDCFTIKLEDVSKLQILLEEYKNNIGKLREEK